MDKIEKGNPLTQSADIVKENLETLKRLFPTIVKEGKIDVDELKALIDDEVETSEEYYRFTWAGKSEARREANKPSTGTLRPNKADSKDWDSTGNIFIEGDNLEVLKLLQKSYAGEIKMMYFDPPYNTGKDFVYNDDYSDNLSNYFAITGQADKYGNKLSTNTESDGRYHSNWLNLMYPRLKLARNLLTDDGVVFISIDDNEVHNLRKLCDEIFGEENFINTISIKAKPSSGASGGGEDKKLKKNVEYIVCFAKNRETFGRFNDVYEITNLFEYIENYKLSGKSWKYTRVMYSLGDVEYIKDISDGAGETIKIFKHNNVVIKTITELSKELRLSEEQVYFNYFEKIFRDTNAQSSIRQRVIDATDNNDTFYSIQYIPKSGRNKDVLTTLYYRGRNKDLIAWLSDVAVKENDKLVKKDKVGTLWSGFNWNNISKEGDIQYPNGKKPIDLIKRMIELTTSETKDDIILDFFAGSGSTAHAVIDFNKTDNGKRKSISIQLPELISEKDKNELYSDTSLKHIVTVADVFKERMRRSISKIENDLKSQIESEKNNQLTPIIFNNDTIDNSIKAIDLLNSLDLGFKAFKLDSSNIHSWDGSVENFEANLFNAQNNIKDDRTEEDVLFEILLKYGLDLTVPIQEKAVGKCKLYSIGSGVLFICLSDNITTEVAKAIGEWKNEFEPATCRVLFKDNGFIDDVAKTNSVQILRQFGIEECNSI